MQNKPDNAPAPTAGAAGSIPASQLPSPAWDHSRVVPLEGASNFRDIGGYPTTDGRTVRRGLVFRSDHLHTLTSDDLSRVYGLGIRTVHDFRLDRERENQPSRFPAADHDTENAPLPEVIILSTPDVPSLDASIFDVVSDMINGRRPMEMAGFWEQTYEDIVERARPLFVTLFRSLAGADRLPALYHCTGGKDRTGLATNLLLDVLGVDVSHIIDDFLATNALRTPRRWSTITAQINGLGLSDEQLLPLLGVTRGALERARTTVQHNHGTTEQYLLAGGLEPEALDRLRALLLE